MVLFSIIVPLARPNAFIEECVEHCLILDNQDFELLILPDEMFELPKRLRDKKISIVPTGDMGPAEKRDIAMNIAKGKYCAFIDDDAYPTKNWLDVAKRIFDSNEKIGAIGGPGVTPKNDPFLARLSGVYYESKLGSGEYTYRYKPEKGRFIEDFPSVNLIVKTDLFKEIGGFSSEYWPGEDTKFCLDIIKKGHLIWYEPELFVWHHRRPSLIKHFKQLTKYATYRGFFFKKYPETSRRPIYVAPSLFFLGNLAGIVSYTISNELFSLYLLVAVLYLAVVAAFIKSNIVLRLLGTVLTFISHNAYGLWFLIGLTKNKMIR